MAKCINRGSENIFGFIVLLVTCSEFGELWSIFELRFLKRIRRFTEACRRISEEAFYLRNPFIMFKVYTSSLEFLGFIFALCCVCDSDCTTLTHYLELYTRL